MGESGFCEAEGCDVVGDYLGCLDFNSIFRFPKPGELVCLGDVGHVLGWSENLRLDSGESSQFCSLSKREQIV